MGIEVFLCFKGNCREAVKYYAKVFKAPEPEFRTYGEAPGDQFPLSEEQKDLIIYTDLVLNGNRVMFSDSPPGMEVVQGSNFALVILTQDKEELKRLFNELKVGGEVGMELQKTFWTELFGSVTDKFGITWQFSHEAK